MRKYMQSIYANQKICYLLFFYSIKVMISRNYARKIYAEYICKSKDLLFIITLAGIHTGS